jgi:hypothetical protein
MKKKNKELLLETRKNERRFVTTDTAEMNGMYLAETLKRTWTENFVDDNGEVVPIERNEVIAQKGLLIDGNLLSSINFHLIAGDIKEVAVSNQKRQSTHVNCGIVPWAVTATIGQKKHRFLLYANSVQMALDIAKDFIELNFDSSFMILAVKDFNNCIIIKDILKPVGVDGKADTKFYQIDVRVHKEEYDYLSTFVLQAVDVDSAMIVINDWLKTSLAEKAEKDGVHESLEFTTTVESAVIIPCSRTIEKEFTLAYTTEV